MSEPAGELRIPEHLLTSVTRSQFHVIENADISDQETANHLLNLLFDYPERSFYVYVQKNASVGLYLRQAIDAEDILVVQTDLEYFRNPSAPKNFKKIHRSLDASLTPCESTPEQTEYVRLSITLSARKRRAMGVDQILEAQSQKSTNPLKLEPNLWGIGVDLRKLWTWVKLKLPHR